MYGRCFITDISDHYSEEEVPVGTLVKAYIKSIEGSKIDVSLRESRGGRLSIERQETAEHAMPEIKSFDQLKEGERIWGYVCIFVCNDVVLYTRCLLLVVFKSKRRREENRIHSAFLEEHVSLWHRFVKSCSEKGCFVSLGRNIDGRVLLSRLSDKYVASPAKTFPPGKLVQGIVLEVDANKHTIELSLRKSDVTGEMEPSDKARSSADASDFVVGEVVEGTVRRVESFGVFVNLRQSSVVGKKDKQGSRHGLARF